jgi:ABC transporter substrate binding protein
MDRRRFLLTSLAGALAAPLAAGAQQAAKMYRIAMLAAGPSACPETSVTRAFRRGLAEAGYTEERDFILDRRCFPTDDTAAPVAADLLKQRPTVFVAGGHPAAIAVKNLGTVPVVFASVDDPVGSGLVRLLAQPGTNMTGVADITTQLYPKRVEILKEALPTLRRMAYLRLVVTGHVPTTVVGGGRDARRLRLTLTESSSTRRWPAPRGQRTPPRSRPTGGWHRPSASDIRDPRRARSARCP